MNVLLVTLSYSNNTGDLLIAEAIADSAASRKSWSVRRLPFLYYNGMPGYKWINGLRGICRVWRAVGRNDVVIIAGGNLIIPRVIRFAFSFMLYAYVAKVLKKTFYVAFMGASDRPHWFGSVCYGLGLRTAAHIWARDKHSAVVMEKMARRRDISVTPDGAFFSRDRCGHGNVTCNAKQRIGIVPYEYRDLFWNEQLTDIDFPGYKKQYQNMIKQLIACGYDPRIVVTAEEDRLFGEDLAIHYGLPLYQPSTGKELLDTMCAQVDLVVSTRMHGLISALLCEKGVIALGGQHKIFSLTEQLSADRSNSVVEIDHNMAVNILRNLQTKQVIRLPPKCREQFLNQLESVWVKIGAGT